MIAGRRRQARERREGVARRVAVGGELAGLLERGPRGVRVAGGGLGLAQGGERVGEHVLRMRPACDLHRARQGDQRLVAALQGTERVPGDHQAGTDAAEQPVPFGDVLGVAGEAERALVVAELVLRTPERLHGPDPCDRLGSLDRQRAVEMGNRAIRLVEDLEVHAGDVRVEHRERRLVLQVRCGHTRLGERRQRAVRLTEIEVDHGLRVMEAEAREVVLTIAERLESGEGVLERGGVVADGLVADGHGGLAGGDRARTRVLGLLGLDRVGLGQGEQRVGERLLRVDRAQHARVLAAHARPLGRGRTHGRQRFKLTGEGPQTRLGLAEVLHRISP